MRLRTAKEILDAAARRRFRKLAFALFVLSLLGAAAVALFRGRRR